MLATALVSGLGLGSIYGLIALGFTLTFAVSGTVNFAQGSSVMLGAVMCHPLPSGFTCPLVPPFPPPRFASPSWALVFGPFPLRPFVPPPPNPCLIAPPPPPPHPATLLL